MEAVRLDNCPKCGKLPILQKTCEGSRPSSRKYLHRYACRKCGIWARWYANTERQARKEWNYQKIENPSEEGPA